MASLHEVRDAVEGIPEVWAIHGLGAMPVADAFEAIMKAFGMPEPSPGDLLASAADQIIAEAMRRKGK